MCVQVFISDIDYVYNYSERVFGSGLHNVTPLKIQVIKRQTIKSFIK